MPATRPTVEEKRIRANTDFYLAASSLKLRDQSARWLARKESTKDFIFFVAEHAPKKMEGILYKAAQFATSMKAAGEKDEKEYIAKEETSSGYGRKRTKIDENNRYAEHILDGDYTPKVSAPFFPSDSNLMLIPSKARKTKRQYLKDGEDEDCQQQDDDVEPLCPEPKYERKYSDTEIELGLTRGSMEIQEFVARRFFEEVSVYSGRSRHDLNPIFDAGSKLDFLMAKWPLLDFLKLRLSESKNPEKAIPAFYSMEEPHDVYDGITDIDMRNFSNKIHKVFGQMRLHATINKKAAARDGMSRIAVLDEYAEDKAGAVPKEHRAGQVNKYKAEYHMGRKWLDVANWFDGTGVVLVFIAAGMDLRTFSMAHS